MKDAHSADSNEISYARFFRFLFFWVMADRIYNLLACHLYFQVCHPPKSSKSSQIYKKDAEWAESNEKLFH